MTRFPSLTLGAALAALLASRSLGAAPTPLDTYVQAPDSSFNWKRTEHKTVEQGTVYHLELVSQTWRGQFWSHHLQVLRPYGLRHPEVAFLFITGDGDGHRELKMLGVVAERVGAIVAVVTKVPNQPLYDGRKEDSLIAYTLDQYLRTGDESWPLLFSMVKSTVRAMDTLEAFAQADFGQRIVELKSATGEPYKLSTEARVIPDEAR